LVARRFFGAFSNLACRRGRIRAPTHPAMGGGAMGSSGILCASRPHHGGLSRLFRFADFGLLINSGDGSCPLGAALFYVKGAQQPSGQCDTGLGARLFFLVHPPHANPCFSGGLPGRKCSMAADYGAHCGSSGYPDVHNNVFLHRCLLHGIPNGCREGIARTQISGDYGTTESCFSIGLQGGVSRNCRHARWPASPALRGSLRSPAHTSPHPRRLRSTSSARVPALAAPHSRRSLPA